VRTVELDVFELWLTITVFCCRVASVHSRPIRLLTAGSIALLLGFFCATSAATIIGSVADWDPLAACTSTFLIRFPFPSVWSLWFSTLAALFFSMRESRVLTTQLELLCM